MENHSEHVENFVAFFSTLSYEEQYNTVVPILMSADGFLKWRLKCLLSTVETPDLLTLLPSEIQLLILSLVDGSNLLKACQVSRRWNELIRDCDQLWRKKSKEIGVNIEAKPPHLSWHRAFLTSWKQLHLMNAGRAFKEKYVNLQNSMKVVTAVDYNEGYLCTVTEDDRISIWQLEHNIPVLSFLVDQAVSCIQFRCYATLVCGHFTGILTSWDLTEMNDHFFKNYDSRPVLGGVGEDYSEFSLLKMKYKMHSAPVFSCDFDEGIQLLVSGSADEAIKFWSLRTGVLLHTLSNRSNWVLRVVLTPFDAPGGKFHSVLTMTRDSADRYQWPSEPPVNDLPLEFSNGPWGDLGSIKDKASIRLDEDHFIMPGMQISARTVGFVKQDLQEKQATLELLNRATLAPSSSLLISFKVRKLMALGERFALFLTVGKILFTSTLVVLDLCTGATVAMKTIPHSKMTTPDGAQIMVGDTQWLDGLAGWNFFGGSEEDNGVASSVDHDKFPDVKKNCGASEVDGFTQDSTSAEEGRFCNDAINSGVISNEDETDPKESLSKRHKNSTQGSRNESSCRSLVLAAGVRSEEGRVFTLWWGMNEESKKKVD